MRDAPTPPVAVSQPSLPVAVHAPAEEAAAPVPANKELPWWAEDEDDDGKPYALPQDEIKTKRCTECGKEIDVKASICVHCGHDERTRKKAERTFQPVDRTWEAGWSFERRLTVFLAFQVLNAVTLVLTMVGGQSVGMSITGAMFYVFLQAFLLGTYDRLRVRRNKKGQVEIVQTWRFCFIPAAPKKIDWKEHEGVAIGVYNGTGFVDWWIFLVLLPFFIIPSLLWFWFVIRADRHFMALARDQGFPDVYLYRGLKEDQAREIAQVVSDVTGLPPTSKLT